MRMSNKGLALLKKFEGCILRAYKCPAGVWTIGYGSTGPHVKPNSVITKAEAEALLVEDLVRFEKGVLVALAPMVPLQEEFDAMVSLAFNIGLANFGKSSVVRNYKAGKKASAAASFDMWNKARVGGKLTVLRGLVARRAEEKQLFLSAADDRAVERPHATPKKFAALPESSVEPEAPKPLARSREIIVGSGLGLGGVVELVNSLSVEDLQATKGALTEVKNETQDSFVAKYHVPEVAAVLVTVIGIFLIWKRWKDRKDGVR